MIFNPRDPVTVLGLSGLAVAVRVSEVGSPVQPLVMAAFFLFCPGAALLGPLAWSRTVWWTAVLAASISLSTLVSTTLLYAGAWSPDRVLLLLVLGSLLGSGLHQRSRGRGFHTRPRGRATSRASA